MKMVLLTIAVATSLSAQATEWVCRSTDAGPDHGLELIISESNQTALLSEITIAGPRPLEFGEMLCTFETQSKPDHPDQIYTIGGCLSKGVADAGFEVTLQSGGIAGLTVARVSTISFFGTKPFATMYCTSHPEEEAQSGALSAVNAL